MSQPFFTDVDGPIAYEGPESDNPLAFRWYDADRVVAGRRWRTTCGSRCATGTAFAWDGFDIFGAGTLDRPWHPTSPGSDPMAAAQAEDGRRVRVLRQARRSVLLLPRPRHRPGGHDVRGVRPQPRPDGRAAGEHQERTGVELLWGTANLFSHPRFQAGAATNPDPEVFAYAAAQVAHCMEATHRLGGHNYVLWGGREGYETLLNTDMRRELDQLGRFLERWSSSTSTRSGSPARS